MKKKLIRITTVPLSLSGLLQGQLKFMSNYFDIIAVSSRGEDNALNMVSEYESVPTLPIEMTRKITPFKDLYAVWQLYKLFKKEKPFIVHSHTPKAGTLSMLAAKLARVPHRLHTIAGLPLVEAKGAKRHLLNFVEKITYKCATKIYPNSFGLVDIILENNFTNKGKLKVIANGSSNGIDTSYFDPKLFTDHDKLLKMKSTFGLQNDDFVFVYVGRLVSDKGINELLLAFNKINNENNKVKLLLVGTYENELDPLLPQSMEIIKNNKNIVSVGWVDDVRPYFMISNVLVFPSYREGFPNVVMQSGAMELPSIVTNINGCNEIIDDKKHGIIIPTKSHEAIYKAMDYVLNNKKEAIEMGMQSRANIVLKFERRRVWEALLAEYNDLD
ncbi:glycosyltransferase family 4 protein [Jejuia spongiicola]|uniref:Glycosyltransferase family 4 protein n=1 Tax=Jejuia spongiicola TaxID=2942207 RepID=A0ABT0QDN0_9FLAO|nr:MULTISPECIES: glycosyltransferase family 4 protein [Flavobacteriaceae]MCL6294984.1 glycosyltransferase family 4 protein [Jejuia spongiicola]PIA77521.1 glycosyl transferase family 1 [Gaetbulibacter sp. 4G1]